MVEEPVTEISGNCKRVSFEASFAAQRFQPQTGLSAYRRLIDGETIGIILGQALIHSSG
jgi:hypothetical protein